MKRPVLFCEDCDVRIDSLRIVDGVEKSGPRRSLPLCDACLRARPPRRMKGNAFDRSGKRRG